MIANFARRSPHFLRNQRRFFATKVADYTVMDTNEIAQRIEENTYNPSVRPKFNHAGMCEMIYDAHNVALKPKGHRVLTSIYGLSLYGNYYYYYLVSPVNHTFFALTCISSLIMTMMMMNASMSSQMSVIEMLVLPTRDIVRFLLMNGGIIETTIASVSLIKIDRSRVTFNTKAGDKTYRLIIDLN